MNLILDLCLLSHSTALSILLPHSCNAFLHSISGNPVLSFNIRISKPILSRNSPNPVAPLKLGKDSLGVFEFFSNSGKSTAIYEAVKGSQMLGDLAVVFETEGNWNWEHAKTVGVKCKEVIDEETGEVITRPDGFMLLQGPDLLKRFVNYDHSSSKMGTKPLRSEPVVEDIALYMHQLLDKQRDGVIDQDINFFWDSVGSINCFRGATSNNSNNQWTAGAIGTAFKSLINFRIPSTRRTDSPHFATFAVVQQIWLDNENKVVKHKGGEAFFYAPRLIFHYGGILSHSTEKLKATFQGKDFQYGIETKIRCEKNQVNGVEQKGKLASTPHGYWNPDKLDEYKKIHSEFFKKNLNTTLDDFMLVKEVNPNMETD